jgi:hypothetical protein
MTGRALWYFVTLGGLCALLGFLATLTKEPGFLTALLVVYLVFAGSFLGAGCRGSGKPTPGESGATRR